MLNKLKSSYWFRSGFFTIGERLSAMIMGLGSVMMLTRYFTKSEFGTWVIFLTITSILEVGRIGLLSNGLIKYLSDCTKEEYPKIITASWVLNFMLTCLIALVLWVFSGFLYVDDENGEVLTQIFRIYCVTTFLLIPFFQCNFTQQANLDFKGVFYSTFTKAGVLFAFIFVMFFFFEKGEMNLVNLAIWQAIGSGLASLVSYILTRKYLQFSAEISWKWVSTLFHYGKFVFWDKFECHDVQKYRQIDVGRYVWKGGNGTLRNRHSRNKYD